MESDSNFSWKSYAMSSSAGLLLTLLLLTAGAVSGVSAYADAYPAYWPSENGANSELARSCAKVKDAQPRAADVPPSEVRDALSGCTAEALYYDTAANSHATQADWDKVRACAFAQESNDTLMMLYANGQGVKVNPQLAMHYACGIAAPELEVENMVGVLRDAALDGSRGPMGMDRCRYASVTPTIGICVLWHAQQGDMARDRVLDGLRRGWDAAQRAAFDKLRQALNEFADLRARDETDESGSFRGSDAIEEESRVKKQFASDVENCEKGAFPRESRARYAALDKRLNGVYQGVIHPGAGPHYGTITPDGVLQTQRAWLKYRDAWVTFGKVRYPTVPAYTWKAWLTDRRIRQLEDL